MATQGHTLIRTSKIDWQDDPGIPGFMSKQLHTDAETGGEIKMWYLPPGWGSGFRDEPHRHYHKSVTERAYQLYGDFPHWEFSAIEDHEGDCIIFKRDIFMDRPPGSLHGIFPKPRSQTGAMLIYWNNGRGTSILDKDYGGESVDVPFDGSSTTNLTKFSPARIFNSNDMDWHAHPTVPQWKIKPLADELEGALPVCMVHVPTDWRPAGETSSLELCSPGSSGDGLRWIFIRTGDLKVSIISNDSEPREEIIHLMEGDFLSWSAPNTIGFSDQAASDVGCIALCTGHALISQPPLANS